MFISARHWIIFFVILTLSIAALFWLYLNVQASMYVQAHNASIQLSDTLPTQISVGNYLQTQTKGTLDTEINLDRKLDLPLNGKYLANLQFNAEVPISVDIDYKTMIQVNQIMPLDTNTDLIYQKKFLPQFPLNIDVPIKLDVPFHLKRTYQIPIQIQFDGLVYLDFNESVHLHVQHQFKPQFEMNDPMTMKKIASFNATMHNLERNTTADLDMQMTLPLRQIHP